MNFQLGRRSLERERRHAGRQIAPKPGVRAGARPGRPDSRSPSAALRGLRDRARRGPRPAHEPRGQVVPPRARSGPSGMRVTQMQPQATASGRSGDRLQHRESVGTRLQQLIRRDEALQPRLLAGALDERSIAARAPARPPSRGRKDQVMQSAEAAAAASAGTASSHCSTRIFQSARYLDLALRDRRCGVQCLAPTRQRAARPQRRDAAPGVLRPRSDASAVRSPSLVRSPLPPPTQRPSRSNSSHALGSGTCLRSARCLPPPRRGASSGSYCAARAEHRRHRAPPRRAPRRDRPSRNRPPRGICATCAAICHVPRNSASRSSKATRGLAYTHPASRAGAARRGARARRTAAELPREIPSADRPCSAAWPRPDRSPPPMRKAKSCQSISSTPMSPSATPSGIELRLGGLDDQPPDQLAHQGREALVLLSANVVVFLP